MFRHVSDWLLAILQMVAALVSALSIALAIAGVPALRAGGTPMDWLWVAGIALASFAVLATVEQARLRRELNRPRAARAAIEALSRHVEEGKHRTRTGPQVFFPGQEPSPAEQRRKEECSRLYAEWSEVVRADIERHCPEFLPDWDNASRHERSDHLREIIRELRSRL